MCLLCAEIAKKSMTTEEVARAMMEITEDTEHFQAIADEVAKNYDADEVAEKMFGMYVNEKGERK